MRKEKRHSPGVESLYTGNFASVRARDFPQNPRVGQGMRIRKIGGGMSLRGTVRIRLRGVRDCSQKTRDFDSVGSRKRFAFGKEKTPSGSRNANLRSQENCDSASELFGDAEKGRNVMNTKI